MGETGPTMSVETSVIEVDSDNANMNEIDDWDKSEWMMVL